MVPTCDTQGWASFDPTGHHMNKIDKGLQGDATYTLSIPVSEKKIFEAVLLSSYVPTCDPRVGSVLTPRNHMNKTDKGPQREAKYQISKF